MSFLTVQCGLEEPLPGASIEHHDEAFYRWREAIDVGILSPPFEVVHIDAHADLGLGDNGYEYLLTELLRRPVNDRRDPIAGDGGLSFSNYLAFAVASRWVASLVYVVGGLPEDYWYRGEDANSRPGDLLRYLHRDFNLDDDLQLPVLDLEDLREHLLDIEATTVIAREPVVPFTWAYPQSFSDPGAVSYITLARSPAYTPATADALYDEIRRRFIEPV